MLPVSALNIIYASGSGHTEYVVNVLVDFFSNQTPSVDCILTRAEQAQPEDLLAGDVLILACGSWNTGGVEGQLQPLMYEFLVKRAKDADLAGKPCTVIALGDERYYYTARAGEHLRKFIVDHGGKVCCDPLTIINEPYGQEERVYKWAEKFLLSFREFVSS